MTRLMKIGIAVVAFAATMSGVVLFGGFKDVSGGSPSYRLAKISRGDLARTVSASGTLKAVATTDVGAQVSGMIKALTADFNSQVKAGEVIARIEPAPFEAKLAQANAELAVARATLLMQGAVLDEMDAEMTGLRAALTEAEDTLERKKRLFARKVEPSSAVDTAVALFEQARARVTAGLARQAKQKAQIEVARAQVQQNVAIVKQHQLDLDYTFIRSPVNGVVISRNVDAGQIVAASFQAPVLFRIARDLADMQVSINVDEADIGQVQVGQKMTFTVDAYLGRTFEGKVQQIRKASQQIANVVTYTVVATVDNRDHSLLPGMTANAAIFVSERSGVLKAPNSARRLRLDKDAARPEHRDWVWVMDASGRPRLVPIVSGVTDGNHSEIISGELTEGQSVVIGIAAPAKSRPRKWLRFGF